MKSAGKARSNGLYRHIRTSKEIIRNLLNDYQKTKMPILFTILFFFIFTPFRLQGYYIFLISFTFFIRAGLVSKISPL